MSDKYRTDTSLPPLGSGGQRKHTLPFELPEEEEEDVFSSLPSQDDDDEVLSSVPANDALDAWAPASASAAMLASRPMGRASTSQEVSTFRGPALLVESPRRSPQRVEIRTPRFLIGRERADLAIVDPFVSKWHAKLFIEDGHLMLEDTGSHNGVYLRIADEFILEDHDELIVGQQRLVFRTTWDGPALPAPYDRSVPTLGAPGPSLPARIIRILEEGHVGGAFPVQGRLTIGARGSDVCDENDDQLSSPHASIERKGNKFFLQDLRSQFGTFIRIRGAVELIDGDCFVVGRTRVRISYP